MKTTMKLMVIFWTGNMLLNACASASFESTTQPIDKLTEILARGTLVIATDADYAPQSRLLTNALPSVGTKCESTQYTADQFTGFDADVAKEVAGRLGVEPCFVTPPWSQLVAGNWGDNWDVHVGSVAITYERMSDLYFSQPYYATPTIILVNKDNTTLKRAEDLSGKRIGVCVGCTFETYLDHTLQLPGEKIEYRIDDPQIIGYENEEPAIEDLSTGDGVILDAVITILPLAQHSIEAGKPIKILDDKPLLFGYASVTMDRSSKRDNTRLLNEISNIIKALHADGTLKRLSIEYHGQDLTQEAASFDLSSINSSP